MSKQASDGILDAMAAEIAAAVAAKVLETIRYMRTHRPPWWLYWTPTIMWALTAAIAAADTRGIV